jgi:hypothetical protein
MKGNIKREMNKGSFIYFKVKGFGPGDDCNVIVA